MKVGRQVIQELMKILTVLLQVQAGRKLAQLRFWLINKYQFGIFLFILLLSLFITGCNPDAGRMGYKIEYPSGNIITCMTDLSEPIPIEGSDLQIYTKHIKDKDYTLYILDDEEETLYMADVTEAINRGQMVNGELWICAERPMKVLTVPFQIRTGRKLAQLQSYPTNN